MGGDRPDATHPLAVRGVRCGFTLTELLVVLVILAMVMGLTIGVITTSQESTGLKGAEHSIAGLIRQARHTALSSGAPVQILLSKTDNAATGVSQQLVLADNFERQLVTGPDGSVLPTGVPRDVSDTPTPMPGMAGYGWQGKHDSNDGTLPGRSLKAGRNAPLMRRAGDGFFVSCWVRPPLARNAGTDYRTEYYHLPTSSKSNHGDKGKTKGYLPLVLVGSPDPTQAYAGLTLELRELVVQVGPNGPVVTHHWVPVAWVHENEEATRIDFYPDYADPAGKGRKRPPHASVAATTRNAVNPIGGERWLQLGLLYDGQDLVLYLDDDVASTKTVGQLPPLLSAPGDPLTCHLGWARHPGGDKPCPALIDSVRILRLGAGTRVALPKNVELDHDYRITVDASGLGIAEIDRSDPANPVEKAVDTIGVGHRAGGKARAEIQVTAAGTVTSRMIAPPP